MKARPLGPPDEPPRDSSAAAPAACRRSGGGAGPAPMPASRSTASLGRLGDLEVRLAGSAAEVRIAQRIRYDVFYEELSAAADPLTRRMRRDTDSYDAICDHLLVLDHADRRSADRQLGPEVVGTCRLLRQEIAARHGGFYSAREFDLTPLFDRHPQLRFLELGRSCVAKPYRGKRGVEILWHGIWTYVLRHDVDVMIGCASLPGIDPEALALPLSFLYQQFRAPDEWRVAAHRSRRAGMDRIPASTVDAKAAFHSLPPLIKGYLRAGAFVGGDAVVDEQFGTTDVLIILPVRAIEARYVGHYGAQAERYAGQPRRRRT